MKKFFPRLFGNEGTKKRIASSIESGKIPHAFLIDGDSGSGKLTLALEIASALNCESKHAPDSPLPCGKCNACKRIVAGGFADVSILEKQPEKATLGVGEIREFRKDMYLSATESEYKVYIIRDAEKMTVEAQNALLIVLEEPPKNVIIMLLACGTDKLLTTIKSRAQYVPMQRFSVGEIESFLSEHSSDAARLSISDPAKFHSIALSADGKIGRAIKLTDPTEAAELSEWRRDIEIFLDAINPRVPYATLYGVIAAMPSKRQELLEFFEGIILALRDLIVIKRTGDVPLLFYLDRQAAKKYADQISIHRLLNVYDIISQAHSDCLRNANTSLLLTNLGIKIKFA